MNLFSSPFWTISVIVVCYMAFGLLVYLFQGRLLYFPDDTGIDAAGSFGLRPWPSEKGYLGFTSAKPPSAPRGTFVVWHGNGGSALYRTYFAEALERRGYRVILAEYPGYGGRPGDLSEKSFVSDAVRTVDRVRREFSGPLYLVGESLGCGVAAAVARQRDWVSGVVLITPWAALPDLAQAKYWYFPARWLVRDQYDNIRNLSGYQGPVAVLIAENDEIVPRKHGQRLFDGLKTRKRLWMFKAAGHNSWPADPDEKWWDEVVDFLSLKSE